MPKFALKYPYFIIMLCLMVMLVGVFNVLRMPVDLFPQIDMPVVVVATFYNGMPPQQIEADITNTFERFFTLGANIDHSESRSLTGVSLIKIYFKPGTDPNAALSNIANLAMADLRRLPPGTLPPVVLGMDASSQPVCLVTLKGQGLNETQLKDLAQFQVRNQISNVQGASVPQPSACAAPALPPRIHTIPPRNRTSFGVAGTPYANVKPFDDERENNSGMEKRLPAFGGRKKSN